MPPPSIESEIKSGFAKVFVKGDWKLFKSTTDYYFKKSVFLKRSHIGISGPDSLLIRNIQKRLFLGVGGELLVKAYFLKNGYLINKPADNKKHGGSFHELGTIPVEELQAQDTFTFGNVLDNLHRIAPLTNQSEIKKALLILKVFRNKEGHIVTRKHAFDASIYRAIEDGLAFFYEEGFSEDLKIHISMEPRERAEFTIRKK